ncbi:4-galactosyl-N-acetylglucosaminide 3-alpha-L-fucosyltransferase 9-like [Clarias gariepinus]|uniref:4-galactosyl-N-acetylglucosaminide 3-alpha-L-fucosyltransferase 9-like n=1 Tax=Clarias gariepinus TaxID=13013 RepID=UPI00234C8FF9|nr:4-galactosyl-N-acetylglucosaminide 3-alpha-L-fucosyltransferase 9-like [Clarias gariepinus]
MTFEPRVASFKRLLLSLVLLSCLGGLFYTFYKPTRSWLSFPNASVSTHEVLTDECLKTSKEKFVQKSNKTETLDDFLVKQQQLINKPNTIEEYKEIDDIIMLIWTWPGDYKFSGEACISEFGIPGCQITDDRSQYDKAHGVMFHQRDISRDLQNLLKMPRPLHQKWVWLNMESPSNSKRWPELDGLFNLTSNYRRDSDVWVPVGKIVEAPEKNNTFKIPPKDKLVCWIVSNWKAKYERVRYFNELSKHIKIEAYGRHFNRPISRDDYNKILKSCKFYLSFENSIHKDYFTEKVFNPLKLGTVPVVLGPPRQNYEEFIPPDSFIHVNDFKSPQKLAEHLMFLDKNQKVYEQYFNWRKHFIAIRARFGLEHTCRSCEHIRSDKRYKVFKDLTKWYWG